MKRNWLIQHLIDTGITDNIDASIIEEYIKDSSQSIQSIANNVGIKRTTAHVRIKKIMERELVSSFSAKLNYTNIGLPLKVFILVGYDPHSHKEEVTQKSVAKHLSRIKYVTQVDIITGAFDFLVEIAIDNMSKLGDVIIEEMRGILGVGNTQTLLSFFNFRDGYDTNKQLK